jgi:SAM-dependent methyltransferase
MAVCPKQTLFTMPNVGEKRMKYLELEQQAKESEKKLYLALQKMPLEDLGALFLEPLENYPSLDAALPRMPADEIQAAWTGSSGRALLDQSLSFIREMARFYQQHTGKSLQQSTILDYGCGWGRLIRLLYKFTLPENIYGCDAWEHSLQLCLDARVRANLKLCGEVPTSLPFVGVKFDLIYAFSVFTHLSKKTSQAVMRTLHQHIDPQGLLVITIRPIDYWRAHDQKQNRVDVERMENEHRSRGFAFTPHGRPPIDGDVTYGDTSISCEYIAEKWERWKMVGESLYPADPYQRIVFLTPV